MRTIPQIQPTVGVEMYTVRRGRKYRSDDACARLTKFPPALLYFIVCQQQNKHYITHNFRLIDQQLRNWCMGAVNREIGGCMLPVWPQYFAEAGCLLYVIDLHATSQLAAAVVELQNCMEHPDLQVSCIGHRHAFGISARQTVCLCPWPELWRQGIFFSMHVTNHFASIVAYVICWLTLSLKDVPNRIKHVQKCCPKRHRPKLTSNLFCVAGKACMHCVWTVLAETAIVEPRGFGPCPGH